MCNDPAFVYDGDEIDGHCSECSAETIDGEAIDQCNFSVVQCEKCNYSPCNGSC